MVQLLKMLEAIGEAGRKKVFDTLMVEMFGSAGEDEKPDRTPDKTHEKYYEALQRTITYALNSGESLPRNLVKRGMAVLEYAVTMLEQLSTAFIEPIGPEGRLRVLNALMQERGVEEMPYIFPYTGKPTIAAEEYHRCLKTLIEHAKKSLNDEELDGLIPGEFRIVEVSMDKGGTTETDGTA